MTRLKSRKQTVRFKMTLMNFLGVPKKEQVHKLQEQVRFLIGYSAISD
jgi:hypothetical protein